MAVVMTSSSSFTRFFIVGERPSNYRQLYLEYIRDHAFWEIEGSESEESYGWVSWDDITEFAFADDSCFKDEFIALGIRTDKRKVPGSVLKIQCMMAEKNLINETGQAELSKYQKREIKDALEKQLLRRLPPMPDVCDMVWNTLTDQVYFGSTNQAAIDRFTDLFTSTFRLGLRLAFPFAVGELLNNSEEFKARWEELPPAEFKAPGGETVSETGVSHE